MRRTPPYLRLPWLLAPACAILLWFAAELRQVHAHGEAPSPPSLGAGVLPYPLSFTPCEQGFAAIYPCRSVDLLAYLPLDSVGGGATGNDVWGWTDPVTGREFVLFGKANGTAFVEITDPARPIYLGDLPTASGSSLWRDVKAWGSYALVVSEAPFHGLQVFDLRRLLSVAHPPQTFSADAWYTRFSNAHNVVVNEETGFAYAVGTNTCSGGLHMIDVRDPLRPQFAGCFAGDGYTHDAQCVVYRGPELSLAGSELCFCANEDTLTIVDVTDKQAPSLLSRTDYVGRGYTHQGWLTPDHSYFLLDDEFDESLLPSPTRTYVWDVRNPRAPSVRGVFTNTTLAIDHNQYVQDRGGRWFVFQANYRAGLRVLEILDPQAALLEEVAFFDIYPADDNPAYSGAWSTYPFFPSGTIAISGIEQGLFLVRLQLEGTPPSESSPTATPTASPTASPIPSPPAVRISGQVRLWGNGTPVGAVTVHVSDPNGGRSLATDSGGHFETSVGARTVVTVEPQAQGNTGSAVTVADAVGILRYLVGLQELSATQQLAADATGDGRISTSDAVHLLRYLVGVKGVLRAAQLCGSDWVFLPAGAPSGATVTLPTVSGSTCVHGAVQVETGSTDLAGLDFEGLPFGDVNGSWQLVPGTCFGSRCPAVGADWASVRTGRPRPGPGGRKLVPVIAGRTGTLAGFQLALPPEFQPGRFVHFRRNGQWLDGLIAAHVGNDGTLRVAGARATAVQVTAGEELGWLVFQRASAGRTDTASRRTSR